MGEGERHSLADTNLCKVCSILSSALGGGPARPRPCGKRRARPLDVRPTLADCEPDQRAIFRWGRIEDTHASGCILYNSALVREPLDEIYIGPAVGLRHQEVAPLRLAHALHVATLQQGPRQHLEVLPEECRDLVHEAVAGRERRCHAGLQRAEGPKTRGACGPARAAARGLPDRPPTRPASRLARRACPPSRP